MPFFTWRRAPYRKFESHVIWISRQNVQDMFSSLLFYRRDRFQKIHPSSDTATIVHFAPPKKIDTFDLQRQILWKVRRFERLKQSFYLKWLIPHAFALWNFSDASACKEFPGSLEEGPHVGSSDKSWKRVFKFSSPIPRIGCRRFILLQILPQL